MRVSGYEILSELGRGGMGVVYRARQISLDRPVALKMILAGQYAAAEQRVRFRREAEAVARLQHPNIVQIHDIGEQDGLPYFSMEFVEGGSLAQRIRAQPLSPVDAARLVELLGWAVGHAHQRRIIHRDLKPGNVLLAADGQPKITDFGLAKHLDSSVKQTTSGAILGTPAYMAPEQAGGQTRRIGPAADIYALGVILYELLAGQPPFTGDAPLDTLMKVVSDEPAPPSRLRPEVPPALEAICLKCLRKQPDDRYTSAEALAEDLGRYLRGQPVHACPSEGRGHPRGRTRKAVLTLLIATSLLLLGGLIAHLVFPPPATEVAEEADPPSQSAEPKDAPMTPRPDDSQSLKAEAIRVLGRKLLPLHQRRIGEAGGSSQGEDFEDYYSRHRARGPGWLKVIYLQPVGEFTKAQARLLDDTEDLLRRSFGNAQPPLDRVLYDRIPARYRRRHESLGAQISADYALERLQPLSRESAVVLAVTTHSIWSGEAGNNYLFGRSYPKQQNAVCSLHEPLGNPEEDYSLCLRRTLKLASGMTALALGINDCTTYTCCMNNPISQASDYDKVPLWFCPECEKKIWWACDLDPVKRYELLVEFAESHQLQEEADFWRGSLAALKR